MCKMETQSKGSVCFRRASVGACLLAYLQAAGFMPVLLAIAAAVEGSHTVSLGCTSDHVSVILHHECGSGTQGFQHHHGPVSRVICLWGNDGPPPPADHVASFNCSTACEKTAGELKARSSQSLSAVGFDWSKHLFPRSPPSFYLSASRVSGSASSAFLGALHTTLLLI